MGQDLLEEITANWKVDAVMNMDYLHKESIRIPQLHGKYFEYQTRLTKLKLKYKKDLDVLTLKKFHYYSGKADPREYVDTDFGFKILKADIPIYLNADSEINELKMKLEYTQYILDFVKDIIKQIHNRTFQIKNYIEYRKFDVGH